MVLKPEPVWLYQRRGSPPLSQSPEPGWGEWQFGPTLARPPVYPHGLMGGKDQDGFNKGKKRPGWISPASYLSIPITSGVSRGGLATSTPGSPCTGAPPLVIESLWSMMGKSVNSAQAGIPALCDLGQPLWASISSSVK